MSTSFNIDCSWPCSWLVSRQTTGFLVRSWFVSSSTLNFLLSWEERVWEAPCAWLVSQQTTGFPFYHVSQLLHEKISWERDVFLAPCAWRMSRQTTGCTVLSWFWVWIRLAWVGTFGLLNNFSIWSLSNFWTQFFHPVMFQRNLWRRPRWRLYLLVYDFSSFHPTNIRNSISWECFVKNDCVRSCLIELQSFLLSKVDVDPIHRILMSLPCFMHVLCKTRYIPSRSCQDPYGFCPSDPQAKRILSVCCSNFDLQVSIPNWWWNVNWLHIQRDECTSRNRPESRHCPVMKDQ